MAELSKETKEMILVSADVAEEAGDIIAAERLRAVATGQTFVEVGQHGLRVRVQDEARRIGEGLAEWLFHELVASGFNVGDMEWASAFTELGGTPTADDMLDVLLEDDPEMQNMLLENAYRDVRRSSAVVDSPTGTVWGFASTIHGQGIMGPRNGIVFYTEMLGIPPAVARPERPIEHIRFVAMEIMYKLVMSYAYNRAVEFWYNEDPAMYEVE